MNNSTCHLIKVNYSIDENGIEIPTFTEREVMCSVYGLSSQEYFSVYRSGIIAICKVIIMNTEYENELMIRLDNTIYQVYKIQRNNEQVILYLKEG